jgi:hypothetical protein
MGRLRFVLAAAAALACADRERDTHASHGLERGPVATDTSEPPLAIDDTTVQGAAAVVNAYYRFINQKDYARAFALWTSNGAASGQTFEQFRRGFAETDMVTASIGAPSRVEGAVGSRYVEVPLRLTAHTSAGEVQRFEGTYTLRRAVVPGATAEQRSWRIHSARVRSVE